MNGKVKHPVILSAIQAVGGQEELARRAGCRQQTISKVLNRQRGVSAELAVAIERATGGAVRREQLRPDLFEPAEGVGG